MNNNFSSGIKKYSLTQILQDNPDYLRERAIELIKKDLKHPGRDFRDATLKAILELLESNSRELKGIHDLLLDIKQIHTNNGER